MSNVVENLEMNSAGWQEVLGSLADMCASEAERMCAEANANVQNGAGYEVEVVMEPRFSFDASAGTTRPVAYARVVSMDADTAADEAENKSLSRAVW